MAEQSYLFDFTRTDDFFENFNINFKIEDMYQVTGYNSDTQTYNYKTGTGGDDKYELVIIFYGDDNFDRYLDTTSDYSKLDEDEVVTGNSMIETVGLDWYNRGDGEASIELHGNIVFDIGEDANVPIKAIVLRDAVTKCVMGYSINMRPFNATNKVVFDDDVIFWDISRFNQ